MDRVIFGDNQFFGVDHLSDDRARQKEQRFRDTREIIRVLDFAHEVGIRTFMCTIYARIAEICDHFRKNPAKYADFKVYPCMPYAHKYANAVTEMGIAGTLKHFTGGVMAPIARGGTAVVQRDAFKLMQILVDAEMSMFRGVSTGVIFLQNVVTDLLLGLGMHEFFYEFSEYVKKKYDAEPGYITMNLPRVVNVLHGLGIENPIVCASINKIGFRMSGGIEANERVLSEKKARVIAMQVYAAGALSPREALAYVCPQEGIESILFGASSKDHLEQTYSLINSLSPATNSSARGMAVVQDSDS